MKISLCCSSQLTISILWRHQPWTFFVQSTALTSIRLSGTQESGWYIQEAKDAMESGNMHLCRQIQCTGL